MPAAVLGQGTAVAYNLIRQHVPFLDRDAVMYPHMEAVRTLVAGGTLRQAVANSVGPC
jgi:histidine ammonia-lyase